MPSTVRRNVVLSTDLDRRLRRALNDREDGMKKGDISEAIAEALEAWLQQRKA
ncbi:MAG: ribbon-helix-helix domain-containing protein [Halobacteriales archaeon]|nr:ribbon-helix-helix domain-containing protein [Halobacteriales archaeon]